MKVLDDRYKLQDVAVGKLRVSFDQNLKLLDKFVQTIRTAHRESKLAIRHNSNRVPVSIRKLQSRVLVQTQNPAAAGATAPHAR